MKTVTIDPKRIVAIKTLRDADMGAKQKHGNDLMELVHKKNTLEQHLRYLRDNYPPHARGDRWSADIEKTEAELRTAKADIVEKNIAGEALREASLASGALYARCVEFLEDLK